MRLFGWVLLTLVLAACSAHTTRVIETPETRQLKGWQKPYEVDGQRYQPLRDHQGFTQRGIASWYGKKFNGHLTSNGEIYDMYAMTAAHKTLPLGVEVRVTNRRNGKSAVVRINDRGPFVAGRVIDLSFSAAKELDVVEQGTAPVDIVALGYPHQQGAKKIYSAPVDYDTGSFAVQVGAFAQEGNAKRLAQKLKPSFTRTDVNFSDTDGRALYRVRVGDFHSLQMAESVKEKLAHSGFPGVFVVAFD
ncbi:septal ring lytic transglycosylase RlpA family protein [Geopsychrobacter electrodiphilus]|uniref:septal ring lytic transglycosylase RlpA family protein n=1 Tax=Geopsychrobacter electrodiphilus TaxID=225196 RepID=UPI00036C4C70|nr:septal ring lytic transglycosylase RlpA family protein [Geopsychrobacter electrodiphilus]